jgi:hypothetical protein
MPSSTRNLPLAYLALSLAAWSQATPYQPDYTSAAICGSCSQEQLAPDLFSVRFHGNVPTSRKTVEA